MRIILSLSLLVACASAPANRVCLIATEIEKGECQSLGHTGDGKDLAFWRADGGVKWCIETFDVKAPIACAPLVLSAAEKAQQVLAQERAKPADPGPPFAPVDKKP